MLLPVCVCAAAGSLSIVEVGPKLVKFAAGAYVGTLESPEQMAVFLYHLDVGSALGGGVCGGVIGGWRAQCAVVTVEGAPCASL